MIVSTEERNKYIERYKKLVAEYMKTDIGTHEENRLHGQILEASYILKFILHVSKGELE